MVDLLPPLPLALFLDRGIVAAAMEVLDADLESLLMAMWPEAFAGAVNVERAPTSRRRWTACASTWCDGVGDSGGGGGSNSSSDPPTVRVLRAFDDDAVAARAEPREVLLVSFGTAASATVLVPLDGNRKAAASLAADFDVDDVYGRMVREWLFGGPASRVLVLRVPALRDALRGLWADVPRRRLARAAALAVARRLLACRTQAQVRAVELLLGSVDALRIELATFVHGLLQAHGAPSLVLRGTSDTVLRHNAAVLVAIRRVLDARPRHLSGRGLWMAIMTFLTRAAAGDVAGARRALRRSLTQSRPRVSPDPAR